MKTWTIRHGSEFWNMHENGAIERPGRVKPDWSTWRVTGAVLMNNFGRTTRRYSLDDIKAGGIQWHYANGKQRVFVTDFDHGTGRMWCMPNHSIN